MRNNVLDIVTFIIGLGVLFGILSFIHVPYAQSELIRTLSYFAVFPVTLSLAAYFLISRIVAKNYKKDQYLVLLVPFLATWISLDVMSWPTYWFAHQRESDTMLIVGVDENNGIGGLSYDLLLQNSIHKSSYRISTTREIFNTYSNNCEEGSQVPVDIFSWWAGSAIKEEQIFEALSTSCRGKLQN